MVIGSDSVTIFTVATGPYIQYWMTQASDADLHAFPSSDLQLVVFTDQPEDAAAHQSNLSRAQVTVVQTPPLGWPAATSQRYALINEHKGISTGSILMHLDADMRIHQDFGVELNAQAWRNGLALVRHPGFFRQADLSDQTIMPARFLRDVVSKARQGGVGSWESRPGSCAFVPRSRRRAYVCGGVWMGRRVEFLGMVEELASRTERDSGNEIVARWHDESYLNWFAAFHDTTLLDPRYCYVRGARNLERLPCIIEAVDKGDVRVRTAEPQ